jgi:flavin reductase (DIM6/NTAB) family NADH-FMN oxidoreductase RutF
MSAAPAPDPLGQRLRRAASRSPSGVALVTAPGGDALVVDSFISLSLEPPLVAFSPARTSMTWRRMRTRGRFGINVLAARHAGGLRERALPGADRLAGLDVELTAYGVPALRDAAAFIECSLEAEHPAGDHMIVIGHAYAIRAGVAGPALVHHGGGFATVAGLDGAACCALEALACQEAATPTH